MRGPRPQSFGNGRLKCTKTEASVRAVPPQASALAALDRLPSRVPGDLLFPSATGGYLDLHNFRNRDWKPAPLALPHARKVPAPPLHSR